MLQFHIKKILGVIQANINAIVNPDSQQSTAWQIASTRPQVIFFGSIAGGTGSGALLDLACAMRTITHSEWDHQAFLMLPGVFRTLWPKLNPHIEENGYAFLKQLDFIMAERDGIVSGKYGDLFTVHTEDDLTYQMVDPFDGITLIDETSQHHTIWYEHPRELAAVVGEMMYAMTVALPLALGQISLRHTPHNFSTPWRGGKRCWYRSMGIAALRTPRPRSTAVPGCLCQRARLGPASGRPKRRRRDDGSNQAGRGLRG